MRIIFFFLRHFYTDGDVTFYAPWASLNEVFAVVAYAFSCAIGIAGSLVCQSPTRYVQDRFVPACRTFLAQFAARAKALEEPWVSLNGSSNRPDSYLINSADTQCDRGVKRFQSLMMEKLTIINLVDFSN